MKEHEVFNAHFLSLNAATIFYNIKQLNVNT